MKHMMMMICAFAVGGALAQQPSPPSAAGAGRDAFLKQQAFAEMQRVTAQMDVLATNQEDLSARIAKTESLRAEIADLKAEVSALRGMVSELRRAMDGQRAEIVKDLSGKIAKMQPAPAPAPRNAGPKTKPFSGECYEYVVQSGDSLFLIAKAFNTSVSRIKELNGMKSDRLSVGQKINVPKE